MAAVASVIQRIFRLFPPNSRGLVLYISEPNNIDTNDAGFARNTKAIFLRSKPSTTDVSVGRVVPWVNNSRITPESKYTNKPFPGDKGCDNGNARPLNIQWFVVENSSAREKIASEKTIQLSIVKGTAGTAGREWLLRIELKNKYLLCKIYVHYNEATILSDKRLNNRYFNRFNSADDNIVFGIIR